MPIGGPRYRITPDPSAAAAGHGAWGAQPSGPLINFGPEARSRQLKHSLVGTPKGDARPAGFLPKASTLDYAHKLTSTTLLLAGVVGYVLFGPRRARTTLRKLAGKHVA